MEGDLCSVCLVVGGGLVYGGADYHTECANYWVNWAEMGHPGVYILPKNRIVFYVRILKILISFHVFTQGCQFLGGCNIRYQFFLQFCLRTFSKSGNF